jgi:hypothetical protein
VRDRSPVRRIAHPMQRTLGIRKTGNEDAKHGGQFTGTLRERFYSTVCHTMLDGWFESREISARAFAIVSP